MHPCSVGDLGSFFAPPQLVTLTSSSNMHNTLTLRIAWVQMEHLDVQIESVWEHDVRAQKSSTMSLLDGRRFVFPSTGAMAAHLHLDLRRQLNKKSLRFISLFENLDSVMTHRLQELGSGVRISFSANSRFYRDGTWKLMQFLPGQRLLSLKLEVAMKVQNDTLFLSG